MIPCAGRTRYPCTVPGYKRDKAKLNPALQLDLNAACISFFFFFPRNDASGKASASQQAKGLAFSKISSLFIYYLSLDC